MQGGISFAVHILSVAFQIEQPLDTIQVTLCGIL